jgi:hypothetical protein
MRNSKTKLLITKFLIGCFLVGVLACSLYAAEGGDLMDELVSAINSHDHVKAKEVSERLKNMGDAAMPMLKRGLTLENKPLKSRILKILNQIETANSTKIILDFAVCEKDKYMVRAAIEALRYPERDIDVEVGEKVLEFLLGKVYEGDLMFSPDAARILGKMKKANPKIRVEACIGALKKEVLRQSDPNTSHKLLPNSYGTEPQFKIRQYIYALGDLGTPAIPFISSTLGTTSDSNLKEYLTICLGFVGDKNNVKALEKILMESKNGEARALSAMALGKLGDKNAIPVLKKALEDPYCVTFEGHRGKSTIFPVKGEAAASLRKLGIKIKWEGDKATVQE